MEHPGGRPTGIRLVRLHRHGMGQTSPSDYKNEWSIRWRRADFNGKPHYGQHFNTPQLYFHHVTQVKIVGCFYYGGGAVERIQTSFLAYVKLSALKIQLHLPNP